MSFFQFMKSSYIKDLTAKGSLARSMLHDNWWPRELNRRVRLLKELRCRNASDDCISTFEECWKEYEECEKRKSSKNSL